MYKYFVGKIFLSKFIKPKTLQLLTMKTRNAYRKFPGMEQKIFALEARNSRFQRIFSEYENISDDLWELQNSENSVPDDFVKSFEMQQQWLEEEIEDWLSEEE